MPDGVPGGTVRGYAVWHKIGDGEFNPVEGTHVVMEENAVGVIDQCKDGSDEQGDLG